MEQEECKISVWLCQEEKLVSGLSRRTTCADVVRVLLGDHNNSHQEGSIGMLSGPPQAYCIVEKWRGFERILPNKTRILRLWAAWGEEQENVRFVLLKNGASLPNNGPRSAEARVVLSKESPCKGAARATMALTQEKQRRIVRKAFRKLAKINKKRQEALSKDSSSVEKMETLVHLVLSQDHTIRQQIQRIKDLDREIDRYEAKIHYDRMKRHGVNYVQDTYLVDASSETECNGDLSKTDHALFFAQLEEYAKKCEEVLQFHEQLTQQEDLIEQITVDIQEELNQRWMKRRQEELSENESTTAEQPAVDSDHQLEKERVKTQLSTSLYIGLRLNTDLETIKNDLDYSQQIWDAKEKELQSLLENINSLGIEDNDPITEVLDSPRDSPVLKDPEIQSCVDSTDGWVEQARGLSKVCDANDEDSDTGLSSMHSQDSDTIPICESLV
uniref:Ras association domain family member 10 n=1 Tax=Latimeria chalumnae TaxID=7897 RepID=H3B3E3_LATCH